VTPQLENIADFELDTKGRWERINLFKRRINGSLYKKPVNIPHVVSPSIGIRDVCNGGDERKPSKHLQFPYRVICDLHIKFQGLPIQRGTGFFIGPKCVLTAGHCVFNGKWAEWIKIYPGSKGGKPYFLFDESKKFKTVEGWFYKQLDDYDHGAIILESDKLYNQVKGFFGFQEISNSQEVINSGYPSDRDSIQVYSKGLPTDLDNIFRFKYMLDTEIGSSGSPVFLKNQDSFDVVGVHTKGGCPNSALKVNSNVIQIWNQWKKESLNQQAIT
jgi:V8-like Glu-specific endopeptidase